MKKSYLFFFLVFLFFPGIMAQDSFVVPSGFEVKDHQSFTGSSLFGRINGGAELFLEYGFLQLDYYQLVKEGKEYNLDIYRMKDPLAAYGIFSIKRFRCRDDSSQNEYVCQTPYQLSFARSEYFVTLANDYGTDFAMLESRLIAEELMKTMPHRKLIIPQFDELFQFEKATFPIVLKGKLGFQNGNPSWESFFEGSLGYTCFYRQATIEGEKVEMFRVDFPGEAEAIQFAKLKNWNPGTGFQNEDKSWYMIMNVNSLVFAKGKIILSEQ